MKTTPIGAAPRSTPSQPTPAAAPTPPRPPPPPAPATAQAPAQRRDSFEAAPAAGASGPAAAVPNPYAAIRERLTGAWVSNGDCAEVHRMLGQLPAPQYRPTVERMQRDGLLSTYVGNLDAGPREAFVRQAADRGMVQRAPAEPAHGRFNPPGRPSMLVNDPALPSPLRGAVREHNAGVAQRYREAFAGYLDRYQAAVGTAGSGADIRALGAPAQPSELWEPGARAGGSGWPTPPSNAAAYQAISNRMHDLTGQRRPGSVWLELQGAVSVENQALGLSARVEAGAAVSDYGRVETSGPQLSGGFRPPLGAASVVVQGTREDGRPQVTVGAGYESNRGSTRVGPGGVHRAGVEANLETGEVEATLALNRNVGGYGHHNQRTGRFGFGATAQAELGPVTLESRIGASLQGLTDEVARRSIDPRNGGMFETPAELSAGTPWESLTAERRRALALLGYDERRWSAGLGR